MAAKRSTIIWLKLVELNNFPDYLKTDLFKKYIAELNIFLFEEMEFNSEMEKLKENNLKVKK